MKRLAFLLIPIALLAVSCNKDKEVNSNVDPQKQAKIDEEHKKFEAYKQELSGICVKNTSEISGAQLAQCKDLKENSEFYDVFGGRVSDADFSYLPESCKRKVVDLTANELAECLADKPAEEDNPFE